MAITESLFGLTPEAVRAQQAADLERRATAFAQLSPMQAAQAGLFRSVSQLGSGIAALGGYQNPEVLRAQQRQGMLSGLDMSSPDALMQAAQTAQRAGDFSLAQTLQTQAQDMRVKGAQAQKLTAEAQDAENKRIREEQLRAALAELPANATPEQYLDVVRRYGSPDKVLTSVQTSIDKEAQRRQALELKKMEIAARMEQARQAGADRMMIAQMQIDGRRELAQFASSLKGAKPEKVLPASLQKAEDADFDAIESVSGLNMSLEPVITSLGGFGSKPVNPSLNLGATNNAMNTARNFLGMSTPESRQYSQLEETKIRIINDSLRLNKGTQTEGDAQRAAREVEAAWAKNDTEATRQALLRLYQINERAKQNKEQQIERRRKSQGISVPARVGTAENPIKLD